MGKSYKFQVLPFQMIRANITRAWLESSRATTHFSAIQILGVILRQQCIQNIFSHGNFLLILNSLQPQCNC